MYRTVRSTNNVTHGDLFSPSVYTECYSKDTGPFRCLVLQRMCNIHGNIKWTFIYSTDLTPSQKKY